MYIRPMDLKGHTKLGSLLLDLKQYANAAREYETLIALNTPDRATAYYKLAQAYLGTGNAPKLAKTCSVHWRSRPRTSRPRNC